MCIQKVFLLVFNYVFGEQPGSSAGYKIGNSIRHVFGDRALVSG